MKVRIKSFKGELLDLTPNKDYTVKKVIAGDLVLISDDAGGERVIHIPYCACLNYGSWEIVND